MEEERELELRLLNERIDNMELMLREGKVGEKTICDDIASEKSLQRLYCELGESALSENDTYHALEAFQKLNDMNGVRRTGEVAFERDFLFDALSAYQLLKDTRGIRKVIQKAGEQKSLEVLEIFMLREEDLRKKIFSGYDKFLNQKGFQHAVSFSIHKVINAANELSKEYELGIGNAKGGLFSAYIFSLFGMPIILCETHKYADKKRIRFKWHDSPEQINDKRVLVFDKDVVTGRSLTRVAREIKRYSPRSLDLFLNHDAGFIGFVSYVRNVPSDFGDVFYPGKMNYRDYYRAYAKIKKIFET